MAEQRVDYFVDVILPLALPNLYTYRVPQALNGSVDVGYRVIVQFGKNKLYSAIVARLHREPPKYVAKFLEGVLDDHAEVTRTQLTFWEWMAQYYMCTRGEVMLAAVPIGLRLSSETKIILHPAWDGMRDHFDDETHALVEAVEVRGVLNLDEISEVLGRKTIMPFIRKLIDAGVLAIYEEIKERYRPKYETFLRLADEYRQEEKLKELFAVLEKRAFKQVETLLTYLHLTGKYTGTEVPVSRAALVKACKDETSGITGLIKRGVLIAEEVEVSRLDRKAVQTIEAQLSPHQSAAQPAPVRSI